MKRWRDVVRKDLKDTEVGEDKCYEEATNSRGGWRNMHRRGIKRKAEMEISWMPVSREGNGAVIYHIYVRTFKSKNGKINSTSASSRNSRSVLLIAQHVEVVQELGELAIHVCQR